MRRDPARIALAPAQARMARAALNLTPEQLRAATSVDFKSITLMEAGQDGLEEVRDFLQDFYEGEGIRFVMTGKFAGAVIPPPEV